MYSCDTGIETQSLREHQESGLKRRSSIHSVGEFSFALRHSQASALGATRDIYISAGEAEPKTGNEAISYLELGHEGVIG